MSAVGAFTFVLHSHIPYARLAGRWPHGEEWIHEAASETYIPLLQTLYDLKEEGLDFKLTIGITPVLGEQLADATVLEHFEMFLDARIEAAENDTQYFLEASKTSPTTSTETKETKPDIDEKDLEVDPHLNYLAQWYKTWYENIKEQFVTRFNRDIIGSFKHTSR